MLEFAVLFQLFAILSSQSLMDAGSALLIVVALVGWFRRPPRERPSFRSGLELLFSVWLVGIAAGLFLWGPMTGREVGLLLEFRWIFELLVWAVALQMADWREKHTRAAFFIILFCGIAAWVSYFVGRPLFDDRFHFVLFDASVPREEGVRRAGGLFNNPMPFAQTYGPLSVALIVLMFGRRLRENLLEISTTILTTLVTILSLTRGVWLAMAGALSFAFLVRQGKRGLVSILAMALVGAIALVSIPSFRSRLANTFDPAKSYDSERWNLWQANLHLFSANPIFGVGYGRNREEVLSAEYVRMGLPADSFNAHAHNQFLNFLAGTGLWGFVCYLILIGIFLKWTLELSRRPGRHGQWALALLCFQICFHLGAMTESNFSISKNRMALLAVWAVVLAMRAASKKAKPA